MDKSFNDIRKQVQRIVNLANSIGGKYTRNSRKRVNAQYYWQMAAHVMAQRGISRFSTPPDERKPIVLQCVTPAKIDGLECKASTAVLIPKPKPSKKKGVPLSYYMDTKENRRYLQTFARHQFIAHMLSDIATDMMVCKMEGWDPYEFSQIIADEMQRILKAKTDL